MRHPPKGKRRWRVALAAITLGLTAVSASRPGLAQATSVPAQIQAELLSKLEAYDRNFTARANGTARTLLLVKPGNARSELSAEDMKAALARLDAVAGLPHQETIVPYAGADALAAQCRDQHVAVVYVTAGFDDDLGAIRASLSNGNVLTLGADSDYVLKGVVLGFALESGKPKIMINLEQAKRQNVSFSSEVLRLMTVYR